MILAGVIRLSFDDRNLTIEQHISDFEKKWNFMRSTLSSGTFPDKNEKFGGYLKGISECDDAKAEFLLLTLPQFYNNLVENIRAKEGYNGDIVRSLSYISRLDNEIVRGEIHQEIAQKTQWYWQPIKNQQIRRVMTKPADIAKRLKDGQNEVMKRPSALQKNEEQTKENKKVDTTEVSDKNDEYISIHGN
jgi:hypothetical protein